MVVDEKVVSLFVVCFLVALVAFPEAFKAKGGVLLGWTVKAADFDPFGNVAFA